MSKESLIPKNVTHSGMKDLSDALYLIAREIEAGFKLMGAEPGKDYTHKDLMKLAMEYAISGGDFAIDAS